MRHWTRLEQRDQIRSPSEGTYVRSRFGVPPGPALPADPQPEEPPTSLESLVPAGSSKAVCGAVDMRERGGNVTNLFTRDERKLYVSHCIKRRVSRWRWRRYLPG